MVISPTASGIRWCMRVSYVDLSCLGRTIYARQFLGAKPPIPPRVKQEWVEWSALRVGRPLKGLLQVITSAKKILVVGLWNVEALGYCFYYIFNF